MTSIQEYHLDFKLAIIVKGLGLCKFAAKALEPFESLEEIWENELSLYMKEVFYVPSQTNSWQYDLK
jgi:hypothetical protein